MRSDASTGPNSIPSRFVLSLKHSKDGRDIYRARFLAGGHTDRENRHGVHDATILKQVSLRLLLALAFVLEFDIFSLVLTPTYLKCSSDMRRKMFLKSDVFNLQADKLLQLV